MAIRNKPTAFVRHKTIEDTEERFKRLLPRGNDLSLIVLKGHLLMEEIITGLIEDHCVNPKALSDARLTFYQKLALVKALTPLSEIDDLCKGINKINSIRNRLAHEIEPKAIHEKIDDFIMIWAEEGFKPPRDAKYRAKMLRLSVAVLCGGLHGCREVLRVVRNTDSAYGKPRRRSRKFL